MDWKICVMTDIVLKNVCFSVQIFLHSLVGCIQPGEELSWLDICYQFG